MADITVKNLAVFLLCSFVLVKYIVPRLGQEVLSRCFGYLVSVVLSYVVAVNYREGKVPVPGKAVLVTGCDTGIGNALARHLDRRGFRVFAGCLDERGEGARGLRDECSGKLQVVQMDVTDDQQVTEVAQFVNSAVTVSGDVLWGVVNNAGIVTLGEIEWVSMARYQQILDVNLLGMIRVIKAFLPMIRKCRGRIVNMSSIQGLYSSPTASPYSISKFGVEALSDCLRNEMAKWRVKTIIVEPGNYAACSKAFEEASIVKMMDSVWSETPDHIKADYGRDYCNSLVDLLKQVSKFSATSLKPVLAAVEDALTDVNPPDRFFPANVYSKIPTWIFCYLPATLTDYMYRISLGILAGKVAGMAGDESGA